jgi:hypothetical protein
MFQQSDAEKEKLREEKTLASLGYQYQTDYGNEQFSLQQEQHEENYGIGTQRLAQTVSSESAQANIAMQGQTRQNLSAMLSMADSEGSANAQAAQSGVKGSSTLGMRLNAQQNAFSSAVAQQNQSNEQSIQNMATRYSNSFEDLGRQLESWEPGGYNYQSQQNTNEYNQNMFNLKMQGYDNAISDATPNWMDVASAGLSGAAQGAGFGNVVGGLFSQVDWGSIFGSGGSAFGSGTEMSGGAIDSGGGIRLS